MVIKKLSQKRSKLELDLTGPDGNAYALMGYASNLAKQLGEDFDPIRKEMMSGDYEHLLKVMEKHFGDFIVMYR